MTDSIVLYMMIIFGVLFLISFLYNFYKYKFDLFKNIKVSKSIYLERSFLIIFIIMVVLYYQNNIILNRMYNNLEHAVKSTKYEDVIKIIDEDTVKLYAQTNDKYRTVLIEYRKKGKKWKIMNNYLESQGSTRWDIEDNRINYYINVIPYIIDDKLVVYMKCNDEYNKSFCENFMINDNLNNTFSFKEKKYDYIVLDNINKDNYSYVFNDITYGL